jgi:hypothetical protein
MAFARAMEGKEVIHSKGFPRPRELDEKLHSGWRRQ